MKKTKALILLVAGNSTRFNHYTKKQFVIINDKPVFIHTLTNMMSFSFDRIIIVSKDCDRDTIKKYIGDFNINASIEYVEGGVERYYSVYNAMKHLEKNNPPDFVFIHDGVRPNVSCEEIENLYSCILEKGAAILAIKISDTVKRTDKSGKIVDTVERDFLYRAATPQAFNFEKYYKAIDKYINENNDKNATDDAQIYSLHSDDVYIVPCSAKNIKITEKSDLDIISL